MTGVSTMGEEKTTMTGEFFLPHGIRGGCARTDKTTDHDARLSLVRIMLHRKLPPTMQSGASCRIENSHQPCQQHDHLVLSGNDSFPVRHQQSQSLWVWEPIKSLFRVWQPTSKLISS